MNPIKEMHVKEGRHLHSVNRSGNMTATRLSVEEVHWQSGTHTLNELQ